jgi:hypothetical protein
MAHPLMEMKRSKLRSLPSRDSTAFIIHEERSSSMKNACLLAEEIRARRKPFAMYKVVRTWGKRGNLSSTPAKLPRLERHCGL